MVTALIASLIVGTTLFCVGYLFGFLAGLRLPRHEQEEVAKIIPSSRPPVSILPSRAGKEELKRQMGEGLEKPKLEDVLKDRANE